jgi:chaperonin GroEL
VTLLRARRVLQSLVGTNLDQTSGIRIVARALEEPLRRIVANAGQESSVVLHRVEASDESAFGYNAATGEYGDMLVMGVIDPVKVARLALQNAASIAALVLTIDCLIAEAPKTKGAPEAVGGGFNPEMG